MGGANSRAFPTRTSRSSVPLPKLVVALDFGTYASGYALQLLTDYEQDRSKIFAPSSWGSHPHKKIPTCILLRADHTVRSFGHNAEKDYFMMNDSDRENHYFFKHFKMRLYSSHEEDDALVEGASGKSLPLWLVISKSIEYLKGEVKSHLQQPSAIYANIDDDTKWVLTVPAIWMDPAKSVMRKAAEKAGIKRDKLAIGLEPECAAIYCKMIKQSQLEYYGAEGGLTTVGQSGSVLMVIDIGGGTVDVAVLDINRDGTMKHVRSSGGGPWGGICVNDNFVLLMRDIVGQDVLEKFGTQHEVEEVDFRMDFEMQKREVKCKSDGVADTPFRIKLPAALAKLWEEKEGKPVAEIIKSKRNLNDKGLEFTRGHLTFDKKEIRQLFDEPVTKIVEFIRDTRKDVNSDGIQIDAAVIVGGFAMSNYMIESLQKHLNEIKIKCLRPNETELAVLYGAVLFGRNENIVSSRIMQCTYGIGFTMEYDPEKHDADQMYELNDKVWANHVFRKHVTRGETIPLDKWISLKEYYPENSDQKKTGVCVFASDLKDPRHTTDKYQCTPVGEFEISFPVGPSRNERAVEISMLCSGTELKFKAKAKQGGKTTYYMI